MSFAPLEDDYAILRQNGVCRQCPLFVGPDNFVFAQWRGGFVKLHKHGRTSARPHVTNIVSDKLFEPDSHGYLRIQFEIVRNHISAPVKKREPAAKLAVAS